MSCLMRSASRDSQGGIWEKARIMRKTLSPSRAKEAAEGDAGKVRVPKTRLIAIAGMTMLWPCVHNQVLYPITFLYSKANTPSSSLTYLAYIMLFMSVIALVVALRRNFVKRLFANRAAMVCVGLMGAAGNACLIFCDFSSFATSTALLAIGITFLAIYTPVFFIFWGTVIVNTSENIAVDVAISYLAFCLISALRLTLSIHASPLAITYALAAATLSYFAIPLISKQYDQGFSVLRLLPLNIVIPGVVLIYLSLLMMQPFTPANASYAYPPNRSYLYWMNAILMVAIILLMKNVKYGGGKAQFKVFALLSIYLALAFFITGFKIALPTQGAASNFTIIASKNAFECFLLIVTLSTCRHKRIDPILPIALLLGLVVTPSNLIRTLIMSSDLLKHISLDAALLACITLAAAVLVLIISNLMLVLIIVKPGATGKTNDESVSLEDRKLSALQEAFQLSSREMDIARLAYHNLPAKKIAEELFIAESTVYTHLKHIYRKADVHSRQEFISLVDSLVH